MRKHINKEYGSFATPCNRCDLEFAFQCHDPQIGTFRHYWTGLPCKATPYTSRERFAINRDFITAVDLWALREMNHA